MTNYLSLEFISRISPVRVNKGVGQIPSTNFFYFAFEFLNSALLLKQSFRVNTSQLIIPLSI